MTVKEEALLKYLEFNLINLVVSIQPHLSKDVNEEIVYGLADDLLVEMRESLTQPTGLTREIPPKT